jgi:Smg protein
MSLRIMDAVGLIGQLVADHWENMSGPQDVTDQLLHHGYSTREITEAFKWIESHTLGPSDKAKATQKKTTKTSKKSSKTVSTRKELALRPALRILTSYEKVRFSPAGHGYLLSLYEKGMLDLLQLEEVIEKAVRSSSDTVGIQELKRMAALVLFTKMQSDSRDLLHSKSSLVQ